MEPTTYRTAEIVKVLPIGNKGRIDLVITALASVVLFQAYRSFERALLLHPSMSLFGLVLLAAACMATSGVTYTSVPRPLRTLMRGLAIASGLYSVLLFPAIPAVAHNFNGWSEQILTGAWLMAAIAALLA